MMDMQKEEYLKAIKNYIKKKRRHWSIDVGGVSNFSDAYDFSGLVLQDILNAYPDPEDRDKYNINKIKVGFKMNDKNNYEIQICCGGR